MSNIEETLSEEMYREHILDLYKSPHNFGDLEGATHKHKGFNPLCGDEITVQLIIKDGKVQAVKFKGQGCAINIASSSLLTDEIKGKTTQAIMEMKTPDVLDLMKIPISSVRFKCALLGLETLQKAVQGSEPDGNA
ncbi:MAG: iron-sulfur cluster assembly scaffold protein [DPANN group archaeon]|nr:iron-sulfur cluster assembly scaffold protein [DPANN group archaeon]